MTAEQITAFGGVLVGLIGALGALLISWRNARLTGRLDTKTDTMVADQVIIKSKVDEVHSETNSRLTRLEAELRETRQELQAANHQAFVAEAARVALSTDAAKQLMEQQRELEAHFRAERMQAEERGYLPVGPPRPPSEDP